MINSIRKILERLNILEVDVSAKAWLSVAIGTNSGLVETKLNFDSITFDETGIWNNSTKKMVIKEAGKYMVGMVAGVNSVSSMEKGLRIRVNGLEVITNVGADGEVSNKRVIYRISELLNLNVGDEVEYYILTGLATSTYAGATIMNGWLYKARG